MDVWGFNVTQPLCHFWWIYPAVSTKKRCWITFTLKVWCIPPRGLLLQSQSNYYSEHKGTVLTKRNDLHQLAGCALIHTENHVKWEIAHESSARRSTGTVSMWVSGFGSTQKQSLETVCWNKRFISVAWEGPITRIHTDTYAHTHTHTLFFTFFWIQQRQYRH